MWLRPTRPSVLSAPRSPEVTKEASRPSLPRFKSQGASFVAGGTQVQIDMESTWSDSDRLTGHLKNEDFFDVPSFSSASFVSTGFAKDDQGHQVTGQLTLHGVTKTITFPATIEVSDASVTVDAEFFIKRFDFGIQYPGRADDLIRDEVVIKLHIVAQPEQA